MVNVWIDGHQVQVEKGSTILQACSQIGIEIPRFCYHERLSIAGNCRMCLVEVEKSAKPVASCAMPVAEGMKVFTETPLVKKAREGVLEFLLINHPLDCPICDQGGECDLQDQAMAYGSDRGRFYEFKRGVDDKNIGPLVKTIMTRCIHCTRCVRFATEIAGVEDLGTTGRGRDTEIGTYVEKAFQSELSGNVIDLCPVGALTSKPYAFTARPWELKSTESIDVSDAVGSNIRIDVRGSEIMRVLPRLHDDVNEEWISDKTRFSYDGLKRQRLTTPLLRQGEQFIPVTWAQALESVSEKLSTASTLHAFAGDLCDTESLVVLRDLFQNLNADRIESTAVLPSLSPDLRVQYMSNSTLAGLENSDVCLLLGLNPRFEATLVNTRLRKAVLLQQLSVYSLGNPVQLTYPHTHLGNDLSILSQILEGRHPFCQTLRRAKRPSVLIGKAFLEHAPLQMAQELTRFVPLIQSNWNGWNVIPLHASSVGALDVGYSPVSKEKDFHSDVTYLMGVDDEAMIQQIRQQSKFVVYQGHHGDVGALHADVILPGAAFTEKEGLYVNLEGRPQKTKVAFYPAGDARQDWKILRALGEWMGIQLPYEDESQLEQRMQQVAPHLRQVGEIQKADASLFDAQRVPFALPSGSLSRTVSQFYMTNVICRASQTMAKCVKSIELPY